MKPFSSFLGAATLAMTASAQTVELSCTASDALAPIIDPIVMKSHAVQVSVGLGAAIIGFCFIIGFTWFVLHQPDGKYKDDPSLQPGGECEGMKDDTELREIAGYIHDGAKTFLVKEYIALTFFVLGMACLVGALFAVLEYCCLGSTVAEVLMNERQLKLDNLSGLWVVFSLLLGAVFSAVAGWLGMFIATKANIRTTHACRTGMGLGLSVAFKSGAVMGLTVCCLGVTGLSILYLAFSDVNTFLRPWTYIAGFGFGASSIALFARVGGGVYTKAADVGADLVGKVENNIPEDDVRNPAVIADNVGDNVGDVAGMGADLFESYAGSIIAACSLAAVTTVQVDTQSPYSCCNTDVTDAGSAWRGCIYGLPALGLKPAVYEDGVRQPDEYWFELCPTQYGINPFHYVAGSADNNQAPMGCTGWGNNGQFYYHLFALPFWIAGVGILASIIGVFSVTTDDNNQVNTSGMTKQQKSEHDIEQLESLLGKTRIGIFVAAGLSLVFSLIVCLVLFQDSEGLFQWRFWGCMIVGLVAGICIGMFTEYCTSYSYYPTKSIAESSNTGPATVIIRGLGVGMISCAVPTLILVIAILAADALASVYGISIAAVGMLSTLGVTLATDAYGPVADNAGGIAEMVDTVPEEVRERTDALDALGNTTAATGKGFAIGSAVLTSVGLITAFMEEAGLSTGNAIDLKEPVVLCGILIGAMLPYLFAALTMLSVGSSAESIILQVRLQFYQAKVQFEKKKPDWWETFTPKMWAKEQDHQSPYKWYETCIAVSTNAALREMVLPGVIAVFAPAVVGFMLGTGALAGLLVGSLTSGFMLAVMMANAGGAWDNAKKYCEKELLGEGKGKGTKYHDACVTGDTVGDPFKDTSGPALNILIKLMSIISLVLAPVFFLLYGTEVEPFLGNSDRSIEPWVAPVIGLILLVLVVVVCVIFCIMNGRAKAAFVAQVDAEMERASAQEDAGAGAIEGGIQMQELRKDTAFAIETHISFTSAEGAAAYEEAFTTLAESRKEYAAAYSLTKVRSDDEDEHRYVEFNLFRSSAHFKQHRMDKGPGTDALKKAMEDYVILEETKVKVYGSVNAEEERILSWMGAEFHKDIAGFVNQDENSNADPIVVVSTFKANNAEDAEQYAKVFANLATQVESYMSTYLLTKDPSDPSNLSMSEILIYRSPDLFEQHSQASFVAEIFAPALEAHIDGDSVEVMALAQSDGTAVVDETMKHVGAQYTDLRAGYKTLSA